MARSKIYALRDENIELKKMLRDKEEKTKRLATKVQKLSEDLSRQRVIDPSQKHTIQQHREPRENRDLIDELRSQVDHLSKTNTTLKTKVQYFKTLHEAETRRRTPYDHIPPRVETITPTSPTRNEEELEQEIQQQALLISALRGKLSESEHEIAMARNETSNLHNTFEK
eukprot:jgi/Hompol1/4523/HPOL_003685-RA